MKELLGRRALLTGASTGIGPYIARRLHIEGVKLTLSARNRQALDELAEELVGSRVVVADLTRREDVERLAAEARDSDIVVANAGLPGYGKIGTLDSDTIDDTIQVNLRAPIMLANLFAPLMRERGSGHIVFIASMAGKMPGAGSSVYNATKFGLRGFAHAIRVELKGANVGVSLVNPTFVSEAGLFAKTGAKSPTLAGQVSPEQVADAVVRAVVENRVEVDVAPLFARVGARVALAAPTTVMNLASGSSRIPDGAVEPKPRD